MQIEYSQEPSQPPRSSQGRAIIHRDARAHAPEHGREHQRPRQVVEHIPARCADRGGGLSGVVAEAVL